VRYAAAIPAKQRDVAGRVISNATLRAWDVEMTKRGAALLGGALFCAIVWLLIFVFLNKAFPL
jgi:hypothetical protein